MIDFSTALEASNILDVPSDGLERLQRYVSEIELWNPRYGLINETAEMDVADQIADCFPGVPFLDLALKQSPGPLFDVGSGVGLPGLAYAILRPHGSVVLIDKQAKRCRFLENAALSLGLDNVEIIHGNVLSTNIEAGVVTNRAFTPLDSELAEAMWNRMGVGTTLVAFKGRRVQVERELGNGSWIPDGGRIIPLHQPFLKGERCLYMVQKQVI